MPGTTAAPTQYAMPGFDWRMTDKEVAAVVSFVRSSWGNQAGAVSASDVAKVRKRARRRSLCVDPGPFAGGASGHSAGSAAGVQDVGH